MRPSVPCYYFLDDNFMILRDQPQLYDTRLGQQYSHDRVRRALRGFSGVLLSTPSLVDYFREHRLHESLALYPPVAGAVAPPPPTDPGEGIRVAFFGGMHRREPFLRYVYPAVCRLGARLPVTLYAAGIDLSAVPVPAGLQIVPMAYNPSYADALSEMSANNIDILVHPSNDTGNNAYKNPHFLINALALGAAPIFSNDPPYNALAADDVAVLCENTEEAWLTALARLADDPVMRDALRARIAAYCGIHFSGASNMERLQMMLDEHSPPGGMVRAARCAPITVGLSLDVTAELARRQVKRVGRWRHALLRRRSEGQE